MNYINVLWNKFSNFPQYKNLISSLKELNNQTLNIQSSLCLAFGNSFSDFSSLFKEPIRSNILESHEYLKQLDSILHKMTSSTSNFPSDLEQIKEFNHHIQELRKTHAQVEEEYKKSDQIVQKTLHDLNNLDSHLNPIEKSKLQEDYNMACNANQESFARRESSKLKLQNSEAEYQKLLIQVIIASFETFSIASYQYLQQIISIGEKIKFISSSLPMVTDSSLEELETRLNFLDTEYCD